MACADLIRAFGGLLLINPMDGTQLHICTPELVVIEVCRHIYLVLIHIFADDVIWQAPTNI